MEHHTKGIKTWVLQYKQDLPNNTLIPNLKQQTKTQIEPLKMLVNSAVAVKT